MGSARWNAEDYAANSQGQLAWALALADRLELDPGSCVLDLGCGDGKISAELARRVPDGRVVGVDRSEDMVELANRTWGASVANLEFRVADAQALDFAEAFDWAFSNSTLHWVPDHPAVLRGVTRALRPGGRLAFSMGGRGTAAVVYEAIADLQRAGRWAQYLADVPAPHYFFGPEEYGGWLSEAGLHTQRLALTPKPMRHATPAALEGWLRTVWTPYLTRVPLPAQPQFLAELVERVQVGCDRAADGGLLLPMVNLEVEAQKLAA